MKFCCAPVNFVRKNYFSHSSTKLLNTAVSCEDPAEILSYLKVLKIVCAINVQYRVFIYREYLTKRLERKFNRKLLFSDEEKLHLDILLKLKRKVMIK